MKALPSRFQGRPNPMPTGVTRMVTKLRWAFSNRVLSQPITVNETGYFRPGEFVTTGHELRRVHRIDVRALVLYVY